MALRRISAALAVSIAVAALGIASAPASVAQSGANTLMAGQRLQWGSARSELVSMSGEFTLSVTPLLAEIDQWVSLGAEHVLAGAPTWATPEPASNDGTDQTSLVLRMTGNLVLYDAEQHVLWSSHTGGLGANHLVMRNNGNLVLYTPDGHAVWSTHTGPAMLPAGQSLVAGQSLWNRVANTHGGGPTHLTMRRTGDLVLYFGDKAVWSTHTATPGSHLTLRDTGNLVVVSPTGRRLWQSATGGAGDETYLYAGQCGRATINSINHGVVWTAGLSSTDGC